MRTTELKKVYFKIYMTYTNSYATLEEVGRKYNISKQRVWQIVRYSKLGNGDYYKGLKSYNETRKSFDYKVKRNLEQYQEKDLGDLEVPHHSIECKRYAKGNWYKEDWWQQVCKSSGPNKIPVLIWKYDRQPIRVCMPLWAIDYNDTRKDLGYCKGDNTITMVMTLDNWLRHVLAYNL